MRHLIWKELRELSVPVLLVTLGATLYWFDEFPWITRVLREPQIQAQAAAVTLATFAGLLLAFWQFTREALFGTRSYLLHRGTGARQAFAAKAGVGLGAMAAVALVPPLWFCLRHAATDARGETAELLRACLLYTSPSPRD